MRFLNEREELVLRTIIEEYVGTGEPVGSRNVSKLGPLKMSPATIRNIMSDLVEKGFIIQPHTSAGRIPTDSGYRYYIDKYVSMESISPEFIKSVQEIMKFDPVNVMALFRSFSKKLGDMTNSVGFIVSPRLNNLYMRHIEFVRLNKETVLAVLVTKSGIVENMLMPMGGSVTDSDLVRMGNFLNDKFADKNMTDIRRELFDSLIEDHGEIVTLMENARNVGKVIFDSPVFDEDFIFDGTKNIIDIPELKESGKLLEVLKTFDEKRNICKVLDDCMTNDSVRIFVGSEIGIKNIDDLGMVIKPYSRGGKIIGTLGVIGPKRMKYPQVVSIVDYSSQIMSRMMSDYYGGDNEE